MKTALFRKIQFPRHSHHRRKLGIVLSVLVLAQAACLTVSSESAEPGDRVVAVNTPRPTNTSEPFVGGSCDAATERIEMGLSYTKHVTAGSYPDNCAVYCLWVPEGNRLEIGISDFDIDLDIYVDMDLTVLAYGDHGMWESNDYGTGDEQVSIGNPEGRYYIQVCSYEALASDFTLYSDFAP